MKSSIFRVFHKLETSCVFYPIVHYYDCPLFSSNWTFSPRLCPFLSNFWMQSNLRSFAVHKSVSCPPMAIPRHIQMVLQVFRLELNCDFITSIEIRHLIEPKNDFFLRTLFRAIFSTKHIHNVHQKFL